MRKLFLTLAMIATMGVLVSAIDADADEYGSMKGSAMDHNDWTAACEALYYDCDEIVNGDSEDADDEELKNQCNMLFMSDESIMFDAEEGIKHCTNVMEKEHKMMMGEVDEANEDKSDMGYDAEDKGSALE